MGIFDSISGAFGGLSSLSDEELEVQREELRLLYVASGDVDEATGLYEQMHRYDEESTRRANEVYEREHPDQHKMRHREHGWYLPNDE